MLHEYMAARFTYRALVNIARAVYRDAVWAHDAAGIGHNLRAARHCVLEHVPFLDVKLLLGPFRLASSNAPLPEHWKRKNAGAILVHHIRVQIHTQRLRLYEFRSPLAFFYPLSLCHVDVHVANDHKN